MLLTVELYSQSFLLALKDLESKGTLSMRDAEVRPSFLLASNINNNSEE